MRRNNDINSATPDGGYSSNMPGVAPDENPGNKPYSEKVDLNDLDWEDRERVLRLLFSKMNAGIPANT